MTDKEILKALLADGSAPQATPEWMEGMARRYPSFPWPAILALRGEGRGTPAATVNELALSVADRQALASLLDDEGAVEPFYPEKQTRPTPSTDSAIDTFLATYGSHDPEEQALMERLIFNPVPDYAQQLAAEQRQETADTGTPKSPTDLLIDSFIASHGSPKPPTPKRSKPSAASPSAAPQPSTAAAPAAATSPGKDESLSESLAKIYIKTRRYERAYEIISRLSLAVPKKNAYFADQLRFLSKLIANEKAFQAQNSNQSTGN